MFQKKVAQILFSTRTMSFLFISFAVAMAIGTFVENSYSTATARAWIYNAWWFEAIMILFALNFLGNIKRYRLLRREKLNTLIFHLSFLLILVGAGVTRYIGYEGIMPIREGETTNVMLSEKTYLSIMMDGEVDGEPLRRAQNLRLNLAPKIDNNQTLVTDFKGQDVEFEVVKFIPAAEEGLVETEDGKKYLKIVEAGDGNRHDHYLEKLFKSKSIQAKNVAYMGDDIPDLYPMRLIGLPTCPQDAVPEVKAISKYISHKNGGKGCGRDLIEQVLKVQGKWLND